MRVTLNLLPPEKKNVVRTAEHFRLAVFQGWGLLFLMGLILGIVGGIRMMLNSQLRALDTLRQTQERQATAKELSEYEALFRHTNQKIAQVAKTEQEHLNWSRVLGELERAAPESIALEKLATKDYVISLVGKAGNREALLQFQSRLNASECFENAQVPLSNLFSQNNIDFQLDVNVKRSCLKS